MQEYKEKATKRRVEEGLSQPPKKNCIKATVHLPLNAVDDATCTRCGRVCKNRRGLNVHQRTCVNKRTTNTHGNATQEVMPAACQQLTISRDVKIIDLLLRNDKGGYICPNKDCGRLLKPQGATAHLKACATSWLEEQGVQV